MNTRQVFEVVHIRAERRWKCTCGKRVTRAKKLFETLNPYNKNARGQPKTRDEIYASLRAKEKRWQPECSCGRKAPALA
jgi:hypothetical protein